MTQVAEMGALRKPRLLRRHRLSRRYCRGAYSTQGGVFVEFQITVADLRDPGQPTEMDCVISVTPGHRVADLSAALSAMPAAGGWAPGGWDSRVQGETGRARLWLGATRLPEGHLLSSSGIRAGARLGLGGPLPGAGPAARGVAELRVVSGPDSGLTVPLIPGEHLLGREGAIRLENTDVSRRHCVITVASDGASFTLRDAGSQNGTGLEGVPVGTADVPVRPGQLIQAGRDVLTITTAGNESPIALRADPGDPFGLLVNRQMRTAPALPQPVIIDLGSGARQERSRAQWLTMILGPAVSIVTGVALGAVTHQWLFLLLSLGGTIASLAPQLVSRRSAAGHAKAGRRKLAEAADAARARLADMTAAEEQARRAALPDPATLGRIATEPGARLWERTPDDEDFLRLRLGTGDLPAKTVSVRGGGGPAGPHEAPDGPVPQILRDVPVAADLAALGVLGIAGHPRGSRAALAWVVAQLAVAHAPGDLRLILLTETPRPWQWARWLPHLGPLGDPGGWLSIGTDPGTRAKRVTELRELIDSRNASAGPPGAGYGAGNGGAGFGGRGYGGRGRRDQLPLVVVIIDGSAGVRDIPGIDQVLFDGPAAGVFVICRDDDPRDLPGACGARLDTDTDGAAGQYTERESGATVSVTRLDRVSERWAHEAARALAPLRDRPSAREGGTNAAVRLNDLWGYDRASATVVEKLWRQGGGRSTAAPVGRLADGSPFVLDIARQGPHMLVGGTTGSGKSQFLQTLVASLAVSSTPQALNFVLIDYKGGATFQPCKDLPHVSGYLTDLDEHLGQRALAALEAESRYREWLITELAGCSDIETYWAAGEPRGPLPRLLVIADEFRFLKETMPEVLKGMTDLAARGRSIGIHLVLATQSPAKAITEDIRDNTRLRVCFRVEEKDGSVKVIDIPDAAGIDPGLQGRGFARIHHGAVARFQGAWASAPAGAGAVTGPAALRAAERPFETLGEPLADQDAPLESSRPGYSGPTDLSELVKAVQDTGRRPPEHRAWLDPLPPLISLARLPTIPVPDDGLLPPIAYGMADLPGEQRQEVLAFSLERGSNLLIGGAGGTGRTTALRSIAAAIATSCSPADAHLYVLDCDSGALGQLDRLPHCGAAVRHTETERAARLLDRLDAEISRRRDLLSAEGFASVTEQRRKTPPAGRLPYLVLLVDGWEAFAADLGQLDSGRLTAALNRLLSQGASAGLRIIVTGGLAALGKLASNCPERIVLRLSGPNDLYSAGVPKGAMPARPAEGRGLLMPAATEVQIAFIGAEPSGMAQTAAMQELIGASRFAFAAPVPAPLRVDPLPSRITLAQAAALPGWHGRGPLRPALAVGGDDLALLGPDLGRVPWFAIAGPIQSGKSTALVVLAESLLAAGTSVIGFAPRESPLRGLDGRDGVMAMFADPGIDPHKLADLLNAATGPVVVLADDADALMGKPVDQVLTQVPVEGRGQGQALVVAGAAADLSRPTRSFATAGPRYRCGLLLTPEDVQQPMMLFAARVPRSAVFDRPAGRGYLFQAGQSVLVQVPEVP
jgi:S-DNA-T family DNA segregation ATPase FtsK/SpoIIIE